MDTLQITNEFKIPDHIKTDNDLKNWLQTECNTKEIHLFNDVF